MRSYLTLAVATLTVVPTMLLADDVKPGGIQPIKVVALNRKDDVIYEKEIEPILINKCQFCHSGNLKEGKLDLFTYDGLMKGGKRGKAVIPGKSGESLLVKLASKNDKPFMPPRTEEPLTPEELALIKLWIDQGAKPPTGTVERRKVVLTALPAIVKPVRAIAVSPDKTLIAAGRANQVHIYNATNGDHLRTLINPELKGPDSKPVQGAHMSIVESMAYSPDGKLLATGSYQEVILWDSLTGTIKQKLTGFADRVVTLGFSPDGKMLATGGGAATEDGEIKVFDVTDNKLVVDIKNGHSDTVFGAAFSPDGKMLATCGADKFVKIFEIPTGKFVKSFEGHTHHVMDVGWKGDGKLLASGGADNAIKIWDFEKGEQVRTVTQHGKQVTRLVFVGKTNQFVTCSGDQTVRMWNVDNGGTVRNFSGNNDFLYAVSVSPDGALVAAGGEEGVVRLYNGTNGQLIKGLLPPGAETPAPKK